MTNALPVVIRAMAHADFEDMRRIYAAGIATRDATGRGLGTQLLTHQIESATASGFWTLQTSIFPENHASLALHRKGGFREVGRRGRIAQLDGVWRTRFCWSVVPRRRHRSVRLGSGTQEGRPAGRARLSARP